MFGLGVSYLFIFAFAIHAQVICPSGSSQSCGPVACISSEDICCYPSGTLYPAGYTCVLDTCIPSTIQLSMTGDPGPSLITATSSWPTPTTTLSEIEILHTLCTNSTDSQTTTMVLKTTNLSTSSIGNQATLSNVSVFVFTGSGTGATATSNSTASPAPTTAKSEAEAIIPRNSFHALAVLVVLGNVLV